jgi:hypothetical protein
VLTLMDALVRELGGDHRDGHRQGRRPGHRMVHLEKACWWTRHRRGDMFLLKLLLRNAFRHRLRTGLTIGLVVAITAFGLLRTLINAWYAGWRPAPAPWSPAAPSR